MLDYTYVDEVSFHSAAQKEAQIDKIGRHQKPGSCATRDATIQLSFTDQITRKLYPAVSCLFSLKPVQLEIHFWGQNTWK